jgi:hypothetical protein
MELTVLTGRITILMIVIANEQDCDDDYTKENIMTWEEFHNLMDREGWEQVSEEIVVMR